MSVKAIFFHIVEFNDTPLIHMHFFVTHHSVILPLCHTATTVMEYCWEGSAKLQMHRRSCALPLLLHQTTKLQAKLHHRAMASVAHFLSHSQQICTWIIQVPRFYSYSPEYTPVITLALCPGCTMRDTCVWLSIIKSNPSQPMFSSTESSILQVCFTLFHITWTLRNTIFFFVVKKIRLLCIALQACLSCNSLSVLVV